MTEGRRDEGGGKEAKEIVECRAVGLSRCIRDEMNWSSWGKSEIEIRYLSFYSKLFCSLGLAVIFFNFIQIQL